MKFRLVILVVLDIVSLCFYNHAFAECIDSSSSVDPPSHSEIYSRNHDVRHFNGDPPSVAKDQLALWKTEDGSDCFALHTSGPNYHGCFISGRLSANASEFILPNKSCSLRFEERANSVRLLPSSGWERMGQRGTCSRSFCGLFGAIESGTFHRDTKWEGYP